MVRPPRRWLIGLAVLLPLALLLAGEWARWPFLQRPLEQLLSDRLGRAFVFGNHFGLQLLGTVRMASDGLRIDGLRPTDVPLLHADEVRLSLSWPTLIGIGVGAAPSPLPVRSLDVNRLELNLQRLADGSANWHFLPSGAAAAAASAPLVLPQVGRLSLRDGLIHVDDAPLALQLTVKVQTHEGQQGLAPDAVGAPRGLQAGAQGSSGGLHAGVDGPLQGQQGLQAHDRGLLANDQGLVASALGQWRGLPLTAELRAAGLLPLADDEAQAPPVPVRLKAQVGRARLALDGTVRDLLHFGGLDGRFDLSGPSLAAVGEPLRVTLPTTAAFDAHGRVRKAGPRWQLDLAALSVGSSRLGGEFVFDTAPAVHRLSGRLTGTRLALPDLGPAFGAPPAGTAVGHAPAGTTAPDSAPRRGGRVLPQREFDIPSLRAMDADVQLQLSTVDVGTALIAPLAPLQARVRLDGGVLSVHDLQASSAGGELRGSLSVDARTELPRWLADLRWAGVRLERLVTLKNPRDGGHPYVSGQLAGHAKLQGSGRSTARMLASLDGSTQLLVREGRVSHLTMELAGIDLAESLGLVVRGDEPLQMRCAVAQLSLREGRVTPQVAVLDTVDTTLVFGGSLSLADESLALVVTASPHDFSPLTLRGPVHVTGPFSAPQVRLDGSRIGLRVVAAAALGALLTPLAALVPLLDFGEADREVCAAALADVKQRARAAAAAAR